MIKNLIKEQAESNQSQSPAFDSENISQTIKVEEEKKPEQGDKIEKEKKDQTESDLKKPSKLPLLNKKQIKIPQVRDEITVKVEKIMEQGLNDAYERLSPIAKQEFKIKGEETALKIRQLLKSTHVKVKKILKLLLEWLRMLPGVNRFFLEQEAKIKAEKIFALKK